MLLYDFLDDPTNMYDTLQYLTSADPLNSHYRLHLFGNSSRAVFSVKKYVGREVGTNAAGRDTN